MNSHVLVVCQPNKSPTPQLLGICRTHSQKDDARVGSRLERGEGPNGGSQGTKQQVSIAYQLPPPGLENAHLGGYRRVRAQSRHEPATATGAEGEAGTGVSTSRFRLAL